MDWPIRGRDAKNWELLSEFLAIGHGDPEGVVRGRLGCEYRNVDGGAGTTLYIKESDDGEATGWVAK